MADRTVTEFQTMARNSLEVFEKIISSCEQSKLEPFCCKKWQKKSQPRNWFREYGPSEGSECYQIDPK
jgi:hypothetical protein